MGDHGNISRERVILDRHEIDTAGYGFPRIWRWRCARLSYRFGRIRIVGCAIRNTGRRSCWWRRDRLGSAGVHGLTPGEGRFSMFGSHSVSVPKSARPAWARDRERWRHKGPCSDLSIAVAHILFLGFGGKLIKDVLSLLINSGFVSHDVLHADATVLSHLAVGDRPFF